MRLLNTHKIQVDEIWADSYVPPYAILSHTWDSEEISLLDIEGLHGYWESSGGANNSIPTTKKRSFEKIRRAVRTARQHGYKYIWVDTCCIDKTSQEEVSDAVNNNFAWYQDAAVCYAYLSDVEPADRDDVYGDKSTFRRSRWFTRGWTLSELIAPAKMEFYAHDWSHLGSKTNDKFLKLLSKASGVPMDILNGEVELDDVCIATRMQWAARRQTTRVEDVGYSLLGIFGVQMSVNYGEGSSAFIRMQQEILPKTHDQSLFAWYMNDESGIASPTPSNGDIRMWGLLADSPKRFTKTGNLKPVIHPSAVENPWGMTGKGLRAGFIIRPCTEFGFSTDIYQARLNCEPRDLSTSPPTIFLKRLWGDQFARILADKRNMGTTRAPNTNEGTFETIFVKQQPTQAVRHIRITVADQAPASGMVDRTPIKWEVISAYPEEYWDKKVTLKTPGFQTGIVGVIRIQVKIPRSAYTVDVAVGMIHDQRSCRSWCQQFKVADDKWTPEDTYERIDELLDGGDITVTNNSTQDYDGTYLPATFSSGERNGYRSLDVTVRISRSWYGSVKPGLRPILKKLNKLQPTVEDGPAHHSDDEPIPRLRNRSMTTTDMEPIGIVSEHELAGQTHDDITGFEAPRLTKRNTEPMGGVHFTGRRASQPPTIQPRIGMYEKNAGADRTRLSGQYEDEDDESESAIDSDIDGVSDGTNSPMGRDDDDLQGRASRLFDKLRDLHDSCRNLMMLGTRRKVPEVTQRHVPNLVEAMLPANNNNRSTSTLGGVSLDGRSRRTSTAGDDHADWHGVCPLHYAGCTCRKTFPMSRRGSQSSNRPSVSMTPRDRRSWIA
ncbi:het domain [Zalerion maritima]|uniref:Het domain n=1 Tax=Zalerion maritima TaxID=339359 RepID=A0AAD5WRT9_9PEZI|nr:het domain [Zalerion maritima]